MVEFQNNIVMKKIISCILLLLLCLLFFWLFTRTDSSSPIRPSRPISPTASSPSPTPTKPPIATHIIPYGNEDAIKPPGVSDADWNRVLRVHAAMKSQNKIVYFYGKVVDQDNAPIPDVKLNLKISRIESSLTKLMLGGKPTPSDHYEVYTDLNGLFRLEDKNGTSVSIESVEKNGYKPYIEKTLFIFGNISTSVNSKDFHRPDPLNPVVITMWKSRIMEAISFSEKNISFKYSEENLDLEKEIDLIPENSKSKLSKVLLKFHVKYQKNNSMEVSIQGVNGIELVKVNDIYHNQAPIEGYTSSLSYISKESNMSDYVYFKSKKEGFYGFCKIGIENYFRGDPSRLNSLHINVFGLKINPNNSPNLEVDDK